MPLPAPASRRPLHTRKVQCQGFFRDDGLWDIEGHITDAKHYAQSDEWRGEMQAGDYVHNMWIRLTLDERLVIHDVEAATDNSPYRVCADAAPNFKKLVGLRIGAGFRKQARERVGGTMGCTHILELLGPVATTAYQTVFSDKARELVRAHRAQQFAARGEMSPPARRPRTAEEMRPPAVMDTCLAWAADGEAVRRWAPLFYTGPESGAVRAQAEAVIRERIAAHDATHGQGAHSKTST